MRKASTRPARAKAVQAPMTLGARPGWHSTYLQPGDTVIVTSTVPDQLNSNASIRHFASAGLRTLDPDFRVEDTPLEIAAAVIDATRPRLVVAIGGMAVDGNELRELRQACSRMGAPLALWLHDDPYELDYAFRAEAVADIIFTNDSWARHHYRHAHVHHLPLAADPASYYRPITSDMRWIEMFFCGHAHPNRVRFFKEASTIMARFAVTLNGSGWPADLTPAVNRRLSPEEVAAMAQRSITTLYLPRDHNIANRRYDLPAATPGPRLFEIALAGSAQLCWTNSIEITDYFDPVSEIVLLDSMRDLVRALERARDEPAHFQDIARAAQQRALNEHCYQHRMSTLLEKVERLAVADDARAPDGLLVTGSMLAAGDMGRRSPGTAPRSGAKP